VVLDTNETEMEELGAEPGGTAEFLLELTKAMAFTLADANET